MGDDNIVTPENDLDLRAWLISDGLESEFSVQGLYKATLSGELQWKRERCDYYFATWILEEGVFPKSAVISLTVGPDPLPDPQKVEQNHIGSIKFSQLSDDGPYSLTGPGILLLRAAVAYMVHTRAAGVLKQTNDWHG